MNKEEIHNIVKEQQSNICQIVSIDNVHIASVTKSIISLLIGIAIDKEMIESVN